MRNSDLPLQILCLWSQIQQAWLSGHRLSGFAGSWVNVLLHKAHIELAFYLSLRGIILKKKKKKKKTFQIVNRAVCREGRNISDNEYVSWYRHSDAGGLFPSLSLSYVSILSPWGQWGHFGLLSITPSTISLPFFWSPQIWGPAHAHTLWSSTAPGALGSLQVFLL